MRKLVIFTIAFSVIFIIILIPRIQKVYSWEIGQTNDTKVLVDYDFFQTELYINKSRESSSNLLVHYNFRNIKSVLLVESLDLKLNQGNLKSICAFDAMDYSEIEHFTCFDSIPVQKRTISKKTKEYYSFRHEFTIDNENIKTVDIEIQAKVRHNDTATNIKETLRFNRESSVKLVPVDHHSDFLYLLILPMSIILIILIIVIIAKSNLKKKNVRLP
jgi:hypothetical protein